MEIKICKNCESQEDSQHVVIGYCGGRSQGLLNSNGSISGEDSGVRGGI